MRTLKRTLSIVLAIAMVLTTFGMVTVSAANYADTPGHWAEAVIDEWTGYGVIQGDGGYFRPDDAITRAEVAQVTQNVIGYAATTENTFTDVEPNAWYTDAILRLAEAGALKGNGDGTMSPDAYMTREEAMTMLGRAYGLTPANTNAGITQYSDYQSISEYANGYIGAMTAAGYVNGYEDGTIRPQATISRAEFVKILDNMIGLYIAAPGTYGPAYVKGLVMVKSGGVNLNGIVASGVVISPSAGGQLTLTNSQVDNNIYNMSSTMTVNSVGSNTTTSGSSGSTIYGGPMGSSNYRTYTVTFYVDGRTYHSTSVRYNNYLTNIPSAPVKEGYTFAGWYTSANYAAQAGTTGIFDFGTTRITGNTSVYAGFIANTDVTPDPNATAAPSATPSVSIKDPTQEYNPEAPAEVKAELVLADGADVTVSGVVWEGTNEAGQSVTLEEGKDYVIEGNNVVFKEEFLNSLYDGTHKVVIETSGGTVQFEIVVNGSAIPVPTAAPATEAPATEAPSSEAPSTEAPATEAPATEAPATEAPATEAPATEAPATEAPSTEAPATEAPATEAPATEVPATEAPATPTPGVQDVYHKATLKVTGGTGSLTGPGIKTDATAQAAATMTEDDLPAIEAITVGKTTNASEWVAENGALANDTMSTDKYVGNATNGKSISWDSSKLGYKLKSHKDTCIFIKPATACDIEFVFVGKAGGALYLYNVPMLSGTDPGGEITNLPYAQDKDNQEQTVVYQCPESMAGKNLYITGNGTNEIVIKSITIKEYTGSATEATEKPDTPATEAPGTEATDTPATDEPGTEATDTPATDEPGTEATDTPATDEPGTEATDTPGTDAPGTEATEGPGTTEPGEVALTWEQGQAAEGNTDGEHLIVDKEGKTGVHQVGRNIFAALPESISTGKLTFETDVYLGPDEPGFRIQVENAAGTNYQNSNPGVIAQNIVATGSGTSVTTLTETGWYHATVVVDYTSGSPVITGTLTAPSGAKLIDNVQATIENVSDTAVKQIRLISRGSTGVTDSYFADPVLKAEGVDIPSSTSAPETTDAPGTEATDAPGTEATDAPGTDATDAPGTEATDAPGTEATDAPGDEPQTYSEYEILEGSEVTINTTPDVEGAEAAVVIYGEDGIPVNLAVTDGKFTMPNHAIAVEVAYTVPTPPAPTVAPSNVITVDGSKDTNAEQKTFKTVNEAIAYAKSMNSHASEADRIQINVVPGIYREQIMIDVNYLTIQKAPETEGDVLFTWYYGIGYQYYSTGSNGYYSKSAYEANKAAGTVADRGVDRWGCATRLTGSNLIAKDIVFENSFNRYITDEEIEDGVKPAPVGGVYSDTGGKPERTKDSNVYGRDFTERAAAIAIEDTCDKTEFYNCQFLSSQDTIYSGSKDNRIYFKNCTIEGQTDYMFGGNTLIFDDCDFNWAGYGTGSAGGHVTAVKNSTTEKGYLLYGGRVGMGTLGGTFVAGDFGRPWGGNDSPTAAIGVQVLNLKDGKTPAIMDSGWGDWSSKAPESKYYEYGTLDAEGNPIDLASKKRNVVLPDVWEALKFNPYNYMIKEGDDWDPMGVKAVWEPVIADMNDLKIPESDTLKLGEDGVYTVSGNFTLPAEYPGAPKYDVRFISNNENYLKIDDKGNVAVTRPVEGTIETSITAYIKLKSSPMAGPVGASREINVSITADPSIDPAPFQQAMAAAKAVLDAAYSQKNDYGVTVLDRQAPIPAVEDIDGVKTNVTAEFSGFINPDGTIIRNAYASEAANGTVNYTIECVKDGALVREEISYDVSIPYKKADLYYDDFEGGYSTVGGSVIDDPAGESGKAVKGAVSAALDVAPVAGDPVKVSYKVYGAAGGVATLKDAKDQTVAVTPAGLEADKWNTVEISIADKITVSVNGGEAAAVEGALTDVLSAVSLADGTYDDIAVSDHTDVTKAYTTFWRANAGEVGTPKDTYLMRGMTIMYSPDKKGAGGEAGGIKFDCGLSSNSNNGRWPPQDGANQLKFVAPADGKWTVYAIPGSNKTFYVGSTADPTTLNGENKPVEVTVDVTKGETYYASVSGSKGNYLGAKFVPTTEGSEAEQNYITSKWTFQMNEGYPKGSDNLQYTVNAGEKWDYVVKNSVGGDSTMTIEATTGKWGGRDQGDWIGVDAEVKLTVPVVNGSKITVGDTYYGTEAYTINGKEFVSEKTPKTYTYYGTDTTVDIVITNGGFFRDVTVISPEHPSAEVPTPEPEKEVTIKVNGLDEADASAVTVIGKLDGVGKALSVTSGEAKVTLAASGKFEVSGVYGGASAYTIPKDIVVKYDSADPQSKPQRLFPKYWAAQRHISSEMAVRFRPFR